MRPESVTHGSSTRAVVRRFLLGLPAARVAKLRRTHSLTLALTHLRDEVAEEHRRHVDAMVVGCARAQLSWDDVPVRVEA